jgi:hypothetical protein
MKTKLALMSVLIVITCSSSMVNAQNNNRTNNNRTNTICKKPTNNPVFKIYGESVYKSVPDCDPNRPITDVKYDWGNSGLRQQGIWRDKDGNLYTRPPRSTK